MVLVTMSIHDCGPNRDSFSRRQPILYPNSAFFVNPQAEPYTLESISESAWMVSWFKHNGEEQRCRLIKRCTVPQITYGESQKVAVDQSRSAINDPHDVGGKSVAASQHIPKIRCCVTADII